jgi:hypothetical protein
MKAESPPPAATGSTAALALGVLALVLPLAGLFLGALAAVLGRAVLRRALAGRPVPARALRRAAWGAFFGLLAVLLNLAAGGALFAWLLLRAPQNS